MTRRFVAAAAIAAGSLVLAACSGGKEPSAAAPAAESAPRIIAIPEGTVAMFADVMNAYDPDKLAGMLTENARLLVPNQPAIEGRQAIVDYYAGVVAAELTYATSPAMAVMLDGVAVAEGTYGVQNNTTGETVERGKYLAVWVNQDGTWKIARLISNTDAPVATGSVSVGD